MSNIFEYIAVMLKIMSEYNCILAQLTFLSLLVLCCKIDKLSHQNIISFGIYFYAWSYNGENQISNQWPSI